MSRLVNFYRGKRTDSEGRLLTEIWEWGDDRLEAVHDFIQWLFPLPEPSAFNSRAPRLTQEDIAAFQSDLLLRSNVLRSFGRLLTFLGLEQTAERTGKDGPNFPSRAP